MGKKINDGLTSNQRSYRKNNGRERSRISTAKFRAEHPEYSSAKSKRYYANNLEKERERKRRYYQDVLKERNKSPEGLAKDRMRKEKRRALLAGVLATLTLPEWIEILNDHHGKCHYCGCDGDMEQDHVIPMSLGGPHSKENVVPACKPCNSSKGNRSDFPVYR